MNHKQVEKVSGLALRMVSEALYSIVGWLEAVYPEVVKEYEEYQERCNIYNDTIYNECIEKKEKKNDETI